MTLAAARLRVAAGLFGLLCTAALQGAFASSALALIATALVLIAAPSAPRRRLLLGWGSALAAGVVAFAIDASLERSVGLGARIGAGVGFSLFLGGAVGWRDGRRVLRWLGVPPAWLDLAGGLVSTGDALLETSLRRHEALRLRLGARPSLAQHATVLSSTVGVALDRAISREELRALRLAAVPGASDGPVLILAAAELSGRLGPLSLRVEAGEWIVLLGASGAGKSSLLRLSAGLEQPTGGLRRFGVERGGGLAQRLDGAVGLLLQEPDDQLLSATPREDVALVLRARGASDEDAERDALTWLVRLGVGALADRPIRAASFGERKRVALAAVLAARPRLLLLDEPTAGLDPRTAAALVETVEQVVGPETAVLWATHDWQRLPRRAARALVLRDGRVLLDGPRATALSIDTLAAAELLAPAGHDEETR